MAAPFSPFPKEVRKERDVLELIRTFDYASSGVSSH
jgi:protein TonB